MNRPIIRQPDDPGVEEPNPYAPIHFQPSMAGRELVMLGHITIGEILPQSGRLVKATVLFRLPDAPRTMFTFTSMTVARRKAAELTREWMEAAGVKK